MSEQTHHTDIIKSGWIDYIPQSIHPYCYVMRLDRPIGIWLLLIPALWAILLASGPHQWRYILLYTIGAFVMRSAGCVINDMWDRDLDRQVERTKTRPLANGDLSMPQAFAFLSLLLGIGLCVLIQLPMMTLYLGVGSLVFVIIYPLMKRVTWWPQAFLGLTFNFGALMGWTSVTETLPWQAWLLYASGFFWTVGYDTIYAMQDRADDIQANIKSSARYLTEKIPFRYMTVALYGFYVMHFALLYTVIIDSYNVENPIWMGVFLIPFAHLIWQVKTLDIANPQNALKRFKSNQYYGLSIIALLILNQSVLI